jgi:transposase InsO family protein
MGLFKMSEQIKERYWLPNMDVEIKHHVQRCQVCQASSRKGVLPKAPQLPLLEVRWPNKQVHVQDPEGAKRYMCVMTDTFTEIVRLKVLMDQTVQTVATCIRKDWCFLYGMPKSIYTDQGFEFCNSILRLLCQALGINCSTTTPYHPQSNAQAEVFNKTMNAYLRKVIRQVRESMVAWEQYIWPLIFSHNTAVHKAMLTSPFYAMFG